jgi:long-chain acyl-CoA synthetase
VISINAPHRFKIGSAGAIIPWLEKEFGGDYIFEDEEGKRNKNIRGELLVKGKSVMKGYWKLEEETARTLENEWLRTGDIGYVDSDGFLTLVGRKKNLLCLKGGEKFYPEFVEEKIKVSPYITQAMIVGEGCTRASVLLNINQDLIAELSKEEADKVIANEVRKAMGDIEAYQRPYKHLVLPDFTMEEGLLTNTQKIRRHKVIEKHKEEIEQLIKSASNEWMVGNN